MHVARQDQLTHLDLEILVVRLTFGPVGGWSPRRNDASGVDSSSAVHDTPVPWRQRAATSSRSLLRRRGRRQSWEGEVRLLGVRIDGSIDLADTVVGGRVYLIRRRRRRVFDRTTRTPTAIAACPPATGLIAAQQSG